jgi:hypothetical protein
VRWGQFNSLGTKGCPLREPTLGCFCENIAKPALGTLAALNSAASIVPVNVMVRMPHPGAMARRRRRLDLISRLLWCDTECAFETADDAANRTADNRANRSRRVVANRGTMGNAVGNALGVDVQRCSEHHDRGGAGQ